MSFTSVTKVAVPPTVITPLSVIAAPEVTDKAPVTPTVPRFTAVVVLSNVKLLVPVVLTPIAPVNAAVPKVIWLLPLSMVKLDVPDTVNVLLSVIAAPAVRSNAPFTVP